jgi:hypothetical protein
VAAHYAAFPGNNGKSLSRSFVSEQKDTQMSRMGITIRMGAAQDTVTFKSRETGRTIEFDRAEMRKARDVPALKALTHNVTEETEVLKDRDRRRYRRAQAAKARARAAQNNSRRRIDNE